MGPFGFVLSILAILGFALKAAVPAAIAVLAIGVLISCVLRGEARTVGVIASFVIASLTLVVVLSWQIYLVFATAVSSLTVETAPTNENLIGVWVPTDHSIGLMAEAGYSFSLHRIEFKPDGTFNIVGVPAAWLSPTDQTNRQLVSVDGSWHVRRDGDSEEVILNFVSQTASLSETLKLEWAPVVHLLFFTHIEGDKSASFTVCGPPRLRWANEMFEPLRPALDKVDRSSLGFTPISSDAVVRIHGDATIGEANEIWLDVYDDTSRTIVFRKQANTYVWIAEDEYHRGPSNDGIAIMYQTDRLNGIPVNEVTLEYPDRLDRGQRHNLSLADLQPVLQEWKEWRDLQPPSSMALCP